MTLRKLTLIVWSGNLVLEIYAESVLELKDIFMILLIIVYVKLVVPSQCFWFWVLSWRKQVEIDQSGPSLSQERNLLVCKSRELKINVSFLVYFKSRLLNDFLINIIWKDEPSIMQFSSSLSGMMYEKLGYRITL